MKRALPQIDEIRFFESLGLLDPSLSDASKHALFEHYEELRAWNPRLSLVGPGTVQDVMERHYGESLAVRPLLKDRDLNILDLGSGGGFPGFVLAAAYPSRNVVLVEARQKKWAFLKAAIRRSGLSCECLNARVEGSLPQGTPDIIHLVTCRAVAITPRFLNTVREHSPQARFLLWLGEVSPELPEGLVAHRSVTLPGSLCRRILEIVPSDAH